LNILSKYRTVMDVYISQTGVNKLTIRKGKKLPAPEENEDCIPMSRRKSNKTTCVASNTGVVSAPSSYSVFSSTHWARDPSPTGESSSSSSVGGISVGETLLKCSISEMSPSSLVLPSPKDSGVDVNSPCHRGDEEGVMSLGGIVHVVDSDVGVGVTPGGGVDVGSDRCRRSYVATSADPYQRQVLHISYFVGKKSYFVIHF